MDLQTSKHVCIVMCFNCYLFLYHVSVQLVESEFHIKINFYVQKLSGKCQYLCVVYTKRSWRFFVHVYTSHCKNDRIRWPVLMCDSTVKSILYYRRDLTISAPTFMRNISFLNSFTLPSLSWRLLHNTQIPASSCLLWLPRLTFSNSRLFFCRSSSDPWACSLSISSFSIYSVLCL